MIDYEKLFLNIPNIKDGDLVLTNSYDFAGVLPSKINLIYINELKTFGRNMKPDWVISVDDVYYSEIDVEKGICCLENNLSFLTARKLEYLYHQQGLYVYKIIAILEPTVPVKPPFLSMGSEGNDEFPQNKYFIILKKRCCSRCKFRNNSCCPLTENNEKVEEHTHEHTHEKKYERFDFVDFIL
jgi:hypothetical protein